MLNLKKMKKIIKILILIFPCLIFSQNDFNNGYKEGYKSGYCYEQGSDCIPPIPPIPPIPRIGESTYTDGYNRGFSDGKSVRNSKNSYPNSSTQSSTISTSKYSPLSMDEIMILSQARKHNGNSYPDNDVDLIRDIILLPFKMLLDWDEISISPTYALSNPNNKLYKNGYGINIDGRFGQHKIDFVYGYSFIRYNQIENSEENPSQHSANIGLGINILKNRNIQLELTPLLEYELNNKSDFGYGGYLGIRKLSRRKNISLGGKYRYTTVSNQISLNLIYTL